ncbi:TIR domain-containing protein [Arcicella aquatica]|uniref:TIR domain-containing protein n=1 Tax=Arcicella aquatica TaxID=217141 RepID=A0ABU5QU14_9BACT|nr:TIR domain-containing protein [Arcicella aquatica]MEA5260149.1 TIR domain-containing protein [Arcicella aquatica]
MSGNEITKIEGLDKLVNLSQLSLSGNKITKIEGLDKLVNLSQLSLSDNEILKIEGLDTLVNLSGLRIEGNPLEKEYNLVLKDDLSHWGIIKNIIDRNTEEGIEITIVLPAKILLLGNHASGKSSLLHYLQNQNLEYKGYSTHLLKIEIYHSKIKEGNPDAIFYDFGGQDYYHGIYRAFLSSGSGYLLLWNKNQNDNKILLKDSKGFATQNFKVNYWLGQKKHLEFSKYNNVTDPLLLIQTYGKANESPLFIADYQDKAIQNTFYISLSEQYNPDKNKAALDYLKAEIDALINDKKRQRLEKEWYVKFYQHIIDEQTVQAETVENLLVYYQPTNKKDNEEIVNSLRAELQQFHNQGLVLFYPEIDESLVWLNPAGLVEYVHTKILQESLISQYQGKVPASQFDGTDYKVIALLEKQKVIFRHQFADNGVEEFIIPNFLPLVKSNETEYDLFTFGLSNPLFTLKFTQFLPIGLINQLICFFGRQPDRKKFWRDQLLFTFEQKCKVLIRLDFELLEIKVLVAFKEGIGEQEQEQISKYLFYCIMAMYWDFEPLLYNSFIIQKTDFQLIINIKSEYMSEIEFENEQDFLKFYNYSYQSIFNNETYRPCDLYLSRDDKYFVKYDELGKHDTKETRIISHQLKADRTEFEKTAGIAVKPFEIFTNKKMTSIKKVFISYSKNDLSMVNRFRDALVPLHDDGIIENPWYCTLLEAGSKWDEEIQQKLSDSDIVFFMCSMSFIRTEYIRKHEIKKAIDLNKTIIPIVLNFCEWDSYLGDYTALPYIAKPVADFNNQDLAWLLVIKGIRISLEQSDQKELSKQVKELYERLVEGKLDNNK